MRPALLTLLVVLTASPLAGQSTSKGDPEVMNYRLSMEKLRKLVPAQRALNALNAKDPQFFEKIDRETKAAGKKGRLTVAEQAAILNQYGAFKRALASVGTTPREWLLTSEAMGSAFVTIEARKGTVTGPPPVTAAQKANVALLEKNEAEFKKILAELDRLSDELLQ